MTDVEHPKAKERREFRAVFLPLIEEAARNRLVEKTGCLVYRRHSSWGNRNEHLEASFVSVRTARDWLSSLEGDDAIYSIVEVHPDTYEVEGVEFPKFLPGTVEQFQNGRTINRVII